ncbi:MarC family protein [Ruegeria sp. R14_0]|uniref:MarC family protein n=1 Tax=Ruegeria sp. R14_0 TaxID=2821100 RepID=UPI001ADA896F|nr:MarC family protein [Ruegeria sp. R14_0]MBO9445158.1 NAAT family transporter [Ruegeria sp. R14_0]
MAELFDHAVFLKYFAALMAIFNPLYGIPIFLSMTQGYTAAERKRVALIVTGSVVASSIAVVLVGEEILAVFGIDVASFRIAGGLIILGIGMSMLNTAEPSQSDQKAVDAGHEKKSNIAVVPLAIPLTFGPATIATTIVFAHTLSDGAEIVTLGAAILIACAITGVGLLFAVPISRFLGSTMINVLTRVMAIILVAVAVEMVLTGAFDAVDARYPGLTGGN